jgi:excisionase family DNA binding protein
MNVSMLMTEEVAAMLRVSPRRVRELIRRGTLPGVRLGRQLRVDPGKLAEFIRTGGQGLAGGAR